MAAEAASTVIQRWQQSMATAGAKVAAGVAKVTIAPSAKAAQNPGAWIAGVQGAQNKWVQNSANSPLSKWQNNMKTKGASSMALGASNLSQQAQSNMAQNLANVESVRQQIDAMPVGKGPNNQARMNAWFTMMGQKKLS